MSCPAEQQPRGLDSPWHALAAAALAFAVVGGCGGGGGGTAFDPHEELLGGDTTVFNTSGGAFGFPLANLSAERSDQFFLGNSFFRTNWVTAPASTAGRDGLGPLFNAVSCSSCHLEDGRSAPPSQPDEVAVGLLFRLSLGPDLEGSPLPDPAYGGQLQPAAILGVPPEGRVEVTYAEEPGVYEDGIPFSLRRPLYVARDLGYGPLAAEAVLGPRIGPSVFGLGLLAAVAEPTILAMADPLDLNGDGISGRVNRVPGPPGTPARLGRFGWKATQATLREQAAAAFLHDIGLTTELFPDEGCSAFQPECAAAPNGGAPEVGETVLGPLTFYLHTLAPPGRRAPTDPQVARGRDLFQSLGCASCHRPLLTTGLDPDFPELSGQTIRPFTDLLLHDLGPDLADGLADHEASGSEWRTPPLWGLGLQQAVSGHTFLLHDGRARDASEAILWHGGEAQASRERFRRLSADERAALIAFLGDL